MKPELSARLSSRSEKETETEAARLTELVDAALSQVAIRSSSDSDSLQSIADRIERAARDLSVALRELAEERRTEQNGME